MGLNLDSSPAISPALINIGVRRFRLKLRNLYIFFLENLLSDFDYVPVYYVGNKNFRPTHPIRMSMRADASEVYLECPHSWGLYIWAKICRPTVFCAFGHIQFSVLRISAQKYWSYPKRAALAICSNLQFVLFACKKKIPCEIYYIRTEVVREPNIYHKVVVLHFCNAINLGRIQKPKHQRALIMI